MALVSWRRILASEIVRCITRSLGADERYAALIEGYIYIYADDRWIDDMIDRLEEKIRRYREEQERERNERKE